MKVHLKTATHTQAQTYMLAHTCTRKHTDTNTHTYMHARRSSQMLLRLSLLGQRAMLKIYKFISSAPLHRKVRNASHPHVRTYIHTQHILALNTHAGGGSVLHAAGTGGPCDILFFWPVH